MPILKGHYRHLIDKDGQVQIPEPIREAAGTDQFVASRGFAECVFLYPEGEWAEIESLVDDLNPATLEARDFYRIVLMWAYDVEASEDGHVRLPPPLCDFAGLEGGVEILGAYDHIEIWDPGRLQAFIDEQPGSYSEVMELLRSA
jgi:MraZ protein